MWNELTQEEKEEIYIPHWLDSMDIEAVEGAMYSSYLHSTLVRFYVTDSTTYSPASNIYIPHWLDSMKVRS